MKVLPWIIGAFGILFVISAVVYFMTPAESLPHFFPGFEAHVKLIHTKHGIGALLLGLACFAYTWFNTGKKSSRE